MAKELQEQLDDLGRRVGKAEERIERFVNGEKDLGAKGMLERLSVMEELYKQYEGLVRVFDWINIIVKWGVRLSPLIGAAMAYMHYNLGSTSGIFGK